MKKISSMIALVMVAFFATTISACSDDNDANGYDWSKAPFEVSTEAMTFSSTGGSAMLYVQSTSSVSLSSSSWLTIEEQPSESKKMHVYAITAPANTTTSNRTETITVTSGKETKTVTITQISTDGLLVTPTTVSVPKEGGQFSVEVVANGDYTVSVGAGWIQKVGTRAGLQTSTCNFTVDANVGTERTTTISFTLNSITESVTVTQEAGTLPDQGMDHSAMELAKMMYPGWNLGNTMEGGNSDNNFTNNGGLGAETSWQGTKTTQAIIDFVKAQGFKSIRIPTAWVMGHITNADDVTIDEAWMARVKEIVNYCVADGLYVILNDHWDGGWLENSFSDISDATVAKNSEILRKLWTQIANAFKDYDEHLLFAGLNEPGMNGGGFNAARTTALIKYEQAFIDAVRATGGNNAVRTLIVQGPETDITQTDNLYDVTRLTDTASGRLMVEVHYYTPWTFCGLESDADWGKMMYYWGEGNDPGNSDRYYKNGEAELKSSFAKMKTKFVDKGYPVIVGECGANYRFGNDSKHSASIRAWYKAVAEVTISNGCVPFYWDTNYTGYPNMTIVNRSLVSVNNQFMLDGVTEGVAAATWPN